MVKTVLSIDPGTQKCGVALVKRGDDACLKLLWHAVVPTEELSTTLKDQYKTESFSLVIVGSATYSRQIQEVVRACMPSMGLLVVDERDTSLQARERYWEHNPRKGWRKLLPSSLQVPPVPVDDFAALVLAERVLLQSG